MLKKKPKNGGETADTKEAYQQTATNEGQDAVVVETGEIAEQINALLATADNAIRERDEYLTLAQRVQADFDNFRRRNQSVRRDAYDEGMRDTLVKLLPVLDNLDRAVAAQGADESLREGVLMVLRQLNAVLQAAGVEEIPAEGAAFDPNLHNAVMQEATEDAMSGAVTGVLQKGYKMGDKVLRHSMVKVAQ